MEGCKPVLTPIEKLTAQKPGKAPDFPYRSAVGALLYVACGTRFDIAFSISVLSRRLENPTNEDVTHKALNKWSCCEVCWWPTQPVKLKASVQRR